MRGLTNRYLLLYAALCVLLPGCASNPRVQPLLPPATLYAEPCSGSLYERAGEVSTQGELHRYTLDLIAALRGCDADRRAIKEWKEGIE